MRTGSGIKDAFGPGLGNAHQFGLAMAARSVVPAMFQQATADPIRAATVAAALRGELVGEQRTINDLLRREDSVNRVICEWAGTTYPGVDLISRAFRQAEAAWGGLTPHDRFIPAGFDLRQIFDTIYGFNAFCERTGSSGFKLHDDLKAWWWFTNDDIVERLPTVAGVIRLDFREVMRPTNMVGAPFGLSLAEQGEWAKPDGLTSVEELILLQLRSSMEFSHSLWGHGKARCRNAYGSARSRSLCVSSGAFYGFTIFDSGRDTDYDLGAVRRKFLALDA